MPQPIRKGIITKKYKPKKKQTTRAARVKQIRERMKGSQEYGTSKLEERFAREFLDKLGIPYIYQYKAASIGRYYDFQLFPDCGTGILVEIDGDYFHSNPLIYEEKKLNKMQRHAKIIDEVKTKYCSRNGIPLIRIWEHDINNNPEMVTKYLKDIIKKFKDKKDIEDNFKHRN